MEILIKFETRLRLAIVNCKTKNNKQNTTMFKK